MPPEPARFRSSALLATLRQAGTAHVYADTADAGDLEASITLPDSRLAAEVDGATVNQPLMRQVVDRVLASAGTPSCLHDVRDRAVAQSEDAIPFLYTAVCGWIGNDLAARFGTGRSWDMSLQLHMGAIGDAAALTRLGDALHKIVPSCLVKVAFTPHAPHCLLVARDLEARGIPVNFTSTFSARQVITAALLANVSRTNIFMGRLNQGLDAERLGEHVDLEAQRALRRLRREVGVKTLLIVASVREWRSVLLTAGCDTYTIPPRVLQELLRQEETSAIASQLETSYEGHLGIGSGASTAVGWDKIARLWRVEPELIDFLLAYRASADYEGLQDGERLARRFEEAGFGGMFYAPGVEQWSELRASKLPRLGSPLTTRLALDTLYSLLADADFAKEQEAIDSTIAGHAALWRRAA